MKEFNKNPEICQRNKGFNMYFKLDTEYTSIITLVLAL